jgi:hypothetical protein
MDADYADFYDLRRHYLKSILSMIVEESPIINQVNS